MTQFVNHTASDEIARLTAEISRLTGEVDRLRVEKSRMTGRIDWLRAENEELREKLARSAIDTQKREFNEAEKAYLRSKTPLLKVLKEKESEIAALRDKLEKI